MWKHECLGSASSLLLQSPGAEGHNSLETAGGNALPENQHTEGNLMAEMHGGDNGLFGVFSQWLVTTPWVCSAYQGPATFCPILQTKIVRPEQTIRNIWSLTPCITQAITSDHLTSEHASD